MVKNYLRRNFASLFFSIFFTLFIITSIVFFIKIASMTSIIKVSFLELTILYLYVLPNILFFTIPITFFASAVISLTKLSFDYELIVLFSLGFSPKKIIRVFFYLALLVSTTLLILSLGLIPLTYQLNKNFIYEKRANASLNIKATEFGQKFGDWLLFIDDNDNGVFSNIALFSNKADFSDDINSSETFIVAKEAKVENQDGTLSFALLDGRGFLLEEAKLNQVDFEKMSINDTSKLKDINYKGVIKYWSEGFSNKKIRKNFSLYILISLFPLISIFLILAFGILNPRYDKNHSYFYIISSTVIYYILIYNGAKTIPFIAIGLIPAIWLIGSYFIYKKRLKRF